MYPPSTKSRPTHGRICYVCENKRELQRAQVGLTQDRCCTRCNMTTRPGGSGTCTLCCWEEAEGLFEKTLRNIAERRARHSGMGSSSSQRRRYSAARTPDAVLERHCARRIHPKESSSNLASPRADYAGHGAVCLDTNWWK